MSFGYQVLGFGSGGGAGAAFIVATGGTITTVCTDYKVHTFTGDGTFCVSAVGNAAGSETVDYMVVAGGAGSGDYHGAGGGAGGYRESPGAASGCYTVSPLGAAPAVAEPVSVQGYPISIGAGGPGGVRPGPNNGGSGGNSIFSSITSAGGGGGGGNDPGGQAGVAGGSGGGGGGSGGGAGGAGNTPPVSPAQGMPGQTVGINKGGGGGGAIQAGNSGPPGSQTRGGDGTATAINPSTCVGTPGPSSPLRYFAGGGGGSCGGPAGQGGHGGGGNGPAGCSCGVVNTGGGAGNEVHIGGSGIVIIRYKYQ